MPIVCKFCNTKLSHKRHLKHHQETVKYCLEIQGKKDSQEEVLKSNTCSGCKKTYSTKSSLNRHQKICAMFNVVSSSVNTNTISNQTASTINNQIVNSNVQNNYINVTYTMGNLTTEHIMATLQPILTTQILKDGISALTDVIIDVLLQKDGKYLYYCTDRSRNQFKMLINHKGEIIEKADPEAFIMRRVLHAPLCNLVSKLTEGNKDKAILGTVDLVKNLRSDGKKFTSEMAVKLPSNPEGIPDELADLLEDSDKFAQEEEERQKTSAKKLATQNAQDQKRKKQSAIDDLLDGSVKHSTDGMYWHKVRHWMISLDKYQNPIILGYAPKITDKMLNLTKAQIQTIVASGLTEYLDEQYKIKSS